jgi:uncharacterized membrane protein YagU involved in acid resistance
MQDSQSMPGDPTAAEILCAGALAGFIATGPMTATMALLFHGLPAQERYSLPPRELTESILAWRVPGLPAGETTHDWLALISHFGYGALTGAAYGFLPAARSHPLSAGMTHGVAVWAGSYLGWIPALNLLAPATHHPPRRNALMIAAHLVWGAALGLGTDRILRRWARRGKDRRP